MANEVLLEKRVDKLEEILAEVIQGLKEMKFRIEEQGEKFDEELRRSREEFERKMEKQRKEFNEALQKSREEQRKELNEALQKSREEFDRKMEEQRKELNKKWGDMARKMGTIVEDIIAPGIEDAIKKKFKEDVIKMMLRVVIKDRETRKRIAEFDIIAETEKRVYVVEVKSKAEAEWIRETKKKVERYKKIYKEEEREVIGVFGSLYIDERIIKYASRKGIYVLGMKGGYLQFLN